MERTALLVGASGLVGNELVKYLLHSDEYKRVTILVRGDYAVTSPKLVVKKVDFDGSPYENLEPVDDIFCCLGTTIKKAKTKENFLKVDFQYPIELAKWGAENGAKQYLVVSAMGANSNSKVFYNQVKGKLEDQLKSLDLPHVHIFRPSLLLGDRKEFRLGEKVGEYVMKFLFFALVGPWRKYRAIEAKQVALAMYKKAVVPTNKAYAVYESDEIENTK
ncbi:NAD(P)H-binding protein [Cytobacillus suaedae]|nr:NAD(P)H-binding protein [Cytobacillus suaedae]